MKPPRYTTHARLDTEFDGTKRFALELVKHMDCFRGCPGKITYLRQLRGNKFQELGSFKFDGTWPLPEPDKI